MIYICEPNGRTNTARYVSHLVKNNRDVRVFTSSENIYQPSCVINAFRTYGSSKGLVKIGCYIGGLVRIIRFLKKGDIYHFHWLKISPLDWLLFVYLSLRGIKIISTVHEILPLESRFYDRFFFGKIYALCSAIIFHTNGVKDKFFEIYKVDAQMEIIKHYTEEISIDSNMENSCNILFFGYIKQYKGLEVLLDSLQYIDDSVDWSLNIVGKNEYDISELMSKFDSKRIHWDNNYVSDERLSEYFRQAEVVVMPYIQIDTSGLLYMARSYQKVILASRLGIFEEEIEDKKNGVLFETGNSRDLGEKMNLLFKSNLMKNIKKEIKENSNNSSKEAFFISHFELYKSCQ